jgi:hypothetical protein
MRRRAAEESVERKDLECGAGHVPAEAEEKGEG